ncbi:MAG: LysM peptidoglycan-binding domain-containing protein [Chloroflexaceae bacterium]|nr:LysM peptidoglycan-binding domain-containing protein [Chloroflexaceae bacterium]
MTANPQTYIVQQGDTLWSIAARLYGDATRWPDVYNANTGTIGTNANLIIPGQQLTLP